MGYTSQQRKQPLSQFAPKMSYLPLTVIQKIN